MKLERPSVKPDQLPALGRQRTVGELGDGGDIRDVPPKAEQEERHGHPEDAVQPDEKQRRDSHQEKAGDLARTAADPIDQSTDDEHERVHADDVQADDGEDIGLVVAVVDDHVATQVHHGDHAAEARDRSDERGEHARSRR